MDVESKATLDSAIDAARQAVEQMEDHATEDVQRSLAGLDGWTITIDVPRIVISLHKPIAK